jgi:hypothetical protein
MNEICGKQPMNNGKERTNGSLPKSLTPSPEETSSPEGFSLRNKKNPAYQKKPDSDPWQKLAAQENATLMREKMGYEKEQLTAMVDSIKVLSGAFKSFVDFHTSGGTRKKQKTIEVVSDEE